MATPRDPAVTEFVRTRLLEVIARGEHGSQDQIAHRLGLSPAYISSMKSGGGAVGGKSIDAFAKLLGYGSADELRKAAYAWYANEAPVLAERLGEPAVAEAIEDVRRLHPLVTEAEILAILGRFAHAAFAGRDHSFWFDALLEEVKQDYRRTQLLSASRQAGAADRRKVEAKRVAEVEDRFRTGHALRRAVQAEVAEGQAAAAADAAAEASAETAVSGASPPRRRRASTK